MHPSKVVLFFSIAYYGETSIWIIRGRFIPEVPSSVIRALWFAIHVSIHLLLFRRYMRFPLDENGGMTILAAWGRDNQRISPYDSLTLIRYRLTVRIFVHLSLVEGCMTFSVSALKAQ